MPHYPTVERLGDGVEEGFAKYDVEESRRTPPPRVNLMLAAGGWGIVFQISPPIDS